MENVCQSCGMPLHDPIYHSTNLDGSRNTTYCSFCFQNGAFIDGCTTLQEKMHQCITVALQNGVPKFKAEDMAKSILPQLSRWKKT